MGEGRCHVSTNDDSPVDPSAAEAASPLRRLVLETFGAKRVAAWGQVAENTVHQWLSRGRIPPAKVPAIVAGARAEGLDAPMSVLWPEMAAHD